MKKNLFTLLLIGSYGLAMAQSKPNSQHVKGQTFSTADSAVDVTDHAVHIDEPAKTDVTNKKASSIYKLKGPEFSIADSAVEVIDHAVHIDEPAKAQQVKGLTFSTADVVYTKSNNNAMAKGLTFSTTDVVYNTVRIDEPQNTASNGVESVVAPATPFRAKLYHSDEPVYFTLSQVSADIEGYDGDEIIVEAVPAPATNPAAANGLKQLAVYGRVPEDYIMRPRLQDDGERMTISIPKGNFSYLKIRVPETALIFVQITNTLVDGKVSVNNVNSIDLEGILYSASVNNVSNYVVELGENWRGMRATGKVTISNVRWTDAPVIVNGKPGHRTCIVKTNNSDVELSVGNNPKTNIIFSSMYSQTYSSLNTDAINAPDKDVAEFRRFNEDPLRLRTLQLGGGGVNSIISSTYGNIFIKK